LAAAKAHEVASDSRGGKWIMLGQCLRKKGPKSLENKKGSRGVLLWRSMLGAVTGVWILFARRNA